MRAVPGHQDVQSLITCIILPGPSQAIALLLCFCWCANCSNSYRNICAVTKFRQDLVRLLNPPHCVQRPKLRCTCQNSQMEVRGFSFILHRHLMFRLKSEFSNFHLSVVSRIPWLARGQALPPALLRRPKAQSAASAPLIRPVWFTILLLTSAISDQPLSPPLMPLQLSRFQLQEYS